MPRHLNGKLRQYVDQQKWFQAMAVTYHVHLFNKTAFRNCNAAGYDMGSLLDPGPISAKMVKDIPVLGQRGSTVCVPRDVVICWNEGA